MVTKEQIGLERISPSKLGAYEECPKLFYYREWLGLQLEQDKLHLDYGNAIHSAIEAIYLQYDDNFGGAWIAADFEKVIERFDRYWKLINVPQFSYEKVMGTNFGKQMQFSNREALFNYMRDDGIIMLKSMWNEKERLIAEFGHDLVNFETSMKVDMYNPLNPNEKLPIPLSLRIDAETRDGLKGVDFKTSKSKYNENDSKKKIQGQCYCFARGYKEFDYIVLRKDLASEDRVEVVRLKFDEADMQAFYHRVEAILTGIAMRQFDRPIKGHQPWCDCKKYEAVLSVQGIELVKQQ